MVQTIPGFYYDEEKKKYFKIQANHAAPPGSQYTTDSVKRKREDQEEQQRKSTLAQRMAIERIVPARALHDPLQRINLEIGSQISSGASIQQRIARAYTSQWNVRSLCRFLNSWPHHPPRPDPGTCMHASRNPDDGALIFGVNMGSSGQILICRPDRGHGEWTYKSSSESCLSRMDSNVSSVSLDRNGILLSTFETGLTGQRACAWVHSLGLDSIFSPVLIRMPAHMDPRASAACPSTDKTLFAIGAVGGICMLEGREGGWNLTKQILKGLGPLEYTNVCSVDWMSPTVVACGMRNSTVCLYDARSNDSAARFRHGRPLNKIRRVGEHRIVVAGDESLRMYDLRFLPAASMDRRSNPYLTFPGYSPSPFSQLDVSPELNVLVTTSRENDFQLWDLHKGVEIPAPKAASARYRGRCSPICVGFEAPGDADGPSLLVGTGRMIDQWSW